MAILKKANVETALEPKNNKLVVDVIKQKRGRKPKNVLQNSNENIIAKNEDNIIVLFEETNDSNDNNDKNDNNNNDNDNDIVLNSIKSLEYDENENENESATNLIACEQKPVMKKRGRKPKGGKIIQQIVQFNNNKETKPNIILHLKCSLKDLQTNTLISSQIESFNLFSSNSNLQYENICENETQSNINIINYENKINQDYVNDNVINNDYQDNNLIKSNDCDIKEIWKKLKVQEHNLHVNNVSDKKSACFWCTYEFDNPPVYIPKFFIKNSYHVYGCFCSPECSTAYLMEENIDSSTKFERYHLLNNIYSKIYNYTKNIKPAPNPYYMLEKYYGNLNIQEYRSLLKNDRLFLIVDKPLTRVMPELHEDNDDFIINNKIIPSNAYQVKQRLQLKKQQTKNNILNEKFGIYQ